MSTTRTYGPVEDGGLRFTNIRAQESGTGAFDSGIADIGFSPAASPVFDGLQWSGFVAGVRGTGTAATSTLRITLSYDVTALSSTALVSAIRTNSFTPDTVVPAGSSATVVQTVRNLSGDLLATSTLTKTTGLADVGDPLIEMGDNLSWANGFGTVSVSLTLEFLMPANTPTTSSLSFSIMRQTYNTSPAVALGDTVFEDFNANGIQDAGDTGIDGVTVRLLDAGGAVVDTAVTAGGGKYAFVSKPPGTYSVRFETPAGGYEASPANQGGNDALDSDAVGGATQQVTLPGGTTDNTLDAGFFRLASLGDFVFLDANADGIQNAGDSALGGVRVELFDAGGDFVSFTTTASDGSYAFTGLRPGDYSVKFVAPEGFAFSPTDRGGNDALDSDAGTGGFSQTVNLISGEHDGTIDAGLIRLVSAISITKLTNGIDGPVLLRDGQVTWTYEVTNTGPVALSNIGVSDDREGPISGILSQGDGDAILAAGESWTFIQTSTASEASYGNIGTVTGDFTDGLGRTTTVTATDPSSYTTVVPAISIAKLTNDVDGLVVLRDTAVTWTYAVTNTGGIDLRDVKVLDDKEGTITAFTGDDGDNVLEVGETWTYSKAGIAEQASYSNIGTVTGTARDDFGNSRVVTASDPSSYRTVQPGIAIEKVTNGIDGPVLLRDGQVTWTYTVTNTGDLALSNVTVTDDREGAITNFTGGDTNTNGLLDRGEIWTFTKSGIAADASYTNIGTATGRGTDSFGNSREVSDTDPSSYTTVVSSISIEKLTNGVDGAVLFEGAAVTWTYAVTNTGAIDLRNIRVEDDQEGPITAFTGDDGDNVLEVGETWTYSKAGIANDASYSNIGTVTGTARDDYGNTRDVTATDPSSYRTISPSITIDKVTNGTDGPTVLTGSPVTWTYTVKNTGNVGLTGVAVTDNVEGVVTNLVNSGNGDAVLDAGETWIFTKAGIAGSANYENRGTVTGTATDGFTNTRTVTDFDDSSYKVATPGISIAKLTNGVDGLVVLRDTAVTWTYAVTNTGNVELSNVTVTDDEEGAITNFVGGDTDSDGRLDLDEVWRFEKSGTASEASYSNIGTARGTGTDDAGNSREVTASDPSSYRTVQPGIAIEKVTNGIDGPVLLRDGQVTWTYTVSNTGDLALSNVTVTDDREGAITNFTGGDANTNGLLDRGEIWTFTKSGIADDASYTNIGTATGRGTDSFGNSRDVSATDPSSYTTVVPSISITKLTNGVDGLVIQRGAAITWTYAVTNDGAIDLRDVRVTDNREGDITAFTGDDGDNVLEVGETWTYSKAGIANDASYANIGTVTGTARDGFGNTRSVTDTDDSSYTTFTLGTLGDEVFFDRNGNGSRDTGEGLSGITVRLDIGNNGSFERSTTTDDNGRYTFTDLPAGSYAVVVDTTTLPGGGRGWQNTTDPDGGANSRSVVTLTQGGSNLLQDFGYRAFDFGDAPDSYATLLASNGPRHVLSTGQSAATPSLFLGTVVDAEATGVPGVPATGDDLDGTPDDEDGIVFLTPVQAGQVGRVQVTVTEAAGVNGRLNAWIDFNRDGDFLDAGERFLTDAAVTNGVQTFDFVAPTTASAGATYARFRLSTDTAAQNPNGLALDGEVEDYALTIQAAPVGRLDIEKSTNGPTNRNHVAPDFNNEDASDGAGVPVLTIGSSVTWTYQVKNIGGTVFTLEQISIVDDDGTPGDPRDDMSIANGRIRFDREIVGDGDLLLEAHETWQYTATGTVENTGSVGTPVTLNLGGHTPTSGTLGNGFTVTNGGISAQVSGFSRDKHTGQWADAYVGRFGGGLGVTDGSEGDGSGNRHTVDNEGSRDNYVLFRFDQNVVVDSAYLGYVVCDSDLRVWIGTANDAFNTNIRLTDAFLAGLGFTEVNETTLTTARLADINAGRVSGNILVIAANTGEATAEDNFKIENLKVQAAGTGVYSNIATVSAPGAIGDSDASHYRSAPSQVARLDIEKTTNGSSNSNPCLPDFNNEDTAGGAGVPVLVAGSDVTWTYRVTNTGEAAFTRAQVSIVDDDGTPTNTTDDMSTANGRIAFQRVVTGDADDLLEAGEVWEYRATGTVESLPPALSNPVTIVMEGSSGGSGAAGNPRTFSSEGVQVTATGFSRDKHTGHWSQGFLGSFGSGLGVTDTGEGNGDNNRHTVDNTGGRDNYVLFRFDQNVVVDSAFLGYVVHDSDLRVWIGTVNNAFSTNIQLSDSFLGGLGFTELNETTLTGARTADFNAGNRAGNVLVIAASPDDTTPEDFFKIEKLNLLAADSGIYKNIATVSAPGATGDSDASHYRSISARPGLDVEKFVSVDDGCTWHDADHPGGPGVKAGDNVQFKFVVTNTGNVALNNIVLSDNVLDLNGSAAGRTITINSLAAANPGHSDTREFIVHATAQSGQHSNTATVTAHFNGMTVTDSDMAHYFGAAGPGVRTPGFWTNTKWQDFWDGDASVPHQAGHPGFPGHDILRATYGSGGPVDPVTGRNTTGILIGDFNNNGRTDAGEHTIFYTVAEAMSVMTGSSGHDARFILDRALVATWLNHLAGNPLEASNPALFDARDAVSQAITWLRRETPDENRDGAGDGNLWLNASHWRVASSSADWNSASSGVQGGNTIKDWLDEYNNFGTVTNNGNTVRIALDADVI